MKNRKSLVESSKVTSRPVLLDAIELTICTLGNRARLYRNLVVTVIAITATSILLTLLTHQLPVLASLLSLVPLTGGYLFLDARLVRRWTGEIVEMARLRRLDMTTFVKTISSFHYLPKNSLKAMISTVTPDIRTFSE